MISRYAYASAMLFALAACSSNNTPEKMGKRYCPQVAFVHDLERVRDYGQEERDAKNLVAEAEFKSIEGKCEYKDGDLDKDNDPERGVDVTYAAKLLAHKGPRLGGDHFEFKYFVAVLNPEQNILNKDMLTANVKFDSEPKGTEFEEPFHVFIPLAKNQDARDWRVLMGFQLTEEQLKAVRDQAQEKLTKKKR